MACYKDAAAKPVKSVPVDPSLSPPYCWISSLKIQDTNGKIHYGTGFKINFPFNRTVIITSAQCIYLNGTYATQITVTFPGQTAIVAKSSNLYAPPEYVSGGNEDFNYGLILLPGRSNDGFGWSTKLTDNDLTSRIVTICGYPGDGPDDTMWMTGGKITSFTGQRIFHNGELVGGQSGSPIYTWHGFNWTVIGLQTCISSPEQGGPRIKVKMISSFVRQMGYPIKILGSVEFDNVFIRCDGSNVIQFEPDGSGTVNCQYSVSSYEKYYIYPPEMPPSLTTEGTNKIVIESAQWEDVYILLDRGDLTQFKEEGGGTVNCQYRSGSRTVFTLKEEGPPGVYSIVSVPFPHLRIRVDGTGVTQFSADGGGTVNCQFYADADGPALPWEKIRIADCAILILSLLSSASYTLYCVSI